jgi:hypothetical protein
MALDFLVFLLRLFKCQKARKIFFKFHVSDVYVYNLKACDGEIVNVTPTEF